MTAKHDNAKDRLKRAAKSENAAPASASNLDRQFRKSPIGPFPTALAAGTIGSACVVPVLVPFAKPPRERGRIFRRGVVERLQLGSAICLIRAYEVTRLRGDSAVKAEQRIGALAPISWDYAGRIANNYLHDTELPSTAIDVLIAAVFGDRVDVLDGLIEAARLCSVGLNLAARITATGEEVRFCELFDAADRLFDVYNARQSDLPPQDVIIVSVVSGIRGHLLWPRYMHLAELIDVALFAGKLIADQNRPVTARRADLHPALFPLASYMLDFLAEDRSQESLDEAGKLAFRLMRAAGPIAELRAAIAAAKAASKDLIIGEGEYWRSNAAREFDKPHAPDVERRKRRVRR
jgi:hypothetical protein